MSISKESILHDIDAATAPEAMSKEEALEFLEDIVSEFGGTNRWTQERLGRGLTRAV